MTGLTECGSCGAPLCGNMRSSGKNKNSFYASYICQGRRTTKNCKLPGVRCELIEDLVIKDLRKSIFNPKSALAIGEKIVTQMSESAPPPEQLMSFKKQLKDCERKINNIVNAIAEGIASDTLKKQLQNLEQQKRSIIDEMNYLKAVSNTELPTPQDIASSIMDIEPLLTILSKNRGLYVNI